MAYRKYEVFEEAVRKLTEREIMDRVYEGMSRRFGGQYHKAPRTPPGHAAPCPKCNKPCGGVAEAHEAYPYLGQPGPGGLPWVKGSAARAMRYKLACGCVVSDLVASVIASETDRRRGDPFRDVAAWCLEVEENRAGELVRMLGASFGRLLFYDGVSGMHQDTEKAEVEVFHYFDQLRTLPTTADIAARLNLMIPQIAGRFYTPAVLHWATLHGLHKAELMRLRELPRVEVFREEVKAVSSLELAPLPETSVASDPWERPRRVIRRLDPED